jgi:hypothetical protein
LGTFFHIGVVVLQLVITFRKTVIPDVLIFILTGPLIADLLIHTKCFPTRQYHRSRYTNINEFQDVKTTSDNPPIMATTQSPGGLDNEPDGNTCDAPSAEEAPRHESRLKCKTAEVTDKSHEPEEATSSHQ